MKKKFLLLTFLGLIVLASCQPANPIPTLKPSDTPIAATIPSATMAPAPTATASPVPKSVNPVYVTAFCTTIGKDPRTTVSAGTPVIITWGWEAKTEALVNDFAQNNLTTITLDGKAIAGIQMEGIQKNEKSGNPEIVWYSEVGVLDPGEHTVTYDVKFKKLVDDGSTTYGPGSKNETLHDQCEIIVE